MKKRINTIVLVICLGLAALLYIRLYLIPDITGAMTSTAVVSYGKLQSVSDAVALIIREERVVYAEQDGTLSYYCEEGEKVRVGTKILDVYPAGKTASSYYCPQTGFVSYYIDDFEENFDYESLAELEPGYMAQADIAPRSMESKNCSKGDPVYKLICSDEWYMALSVSKDDAESYEVGNSLTVRFPEYAETYPEDEKESKKEGDQDEQGDEPSAYTEIPATIQEIYEKEDGLIVLVSTKRYYEDWLKTRFARVQVVTKSYEGLLIPQSSVCESEGQQGVYKLAVSGDYDFVPVQIISKNDEEYLVTADSFTVKNEDGSVADTIATIGIYDEILRNAEDGVK